MKKILLFIFSILGIVTTSSAKEVNPETAKLVAQNMYQQVHNKKGNLDFQLIYSSTLKLATNKGKSDPDGVPLFYVFNAGNVFFWVSLNNFEFIYCYTATTNLV